MFPVAYNRLSQIEVQGALMSFQVSPLYREKHAHLKVDSSKVLQSIAAQHLLPVLVGEIIRVAGDLPVLFVKHSATGQFELVALTSLEAGKNLLLKDGQWQGMYLPRTVRNHPLALMEDANNSEQLLIALIESSPALNAVQGNALFNSDGSDSDYLKQKSEALTQVFHGMQLTKAFCQQLAELNLLQPQTLKVMLAGQPQEIQGLYCIDEQRLNQLSDSEFNALKDSHALPAIYAHLMSLQQLQRLSLLHASAG